MGEFATEFVAAFQKELILSAENIPSSEAFTNKTFSGEENTLYTFIELLTLKYEFSSFHKAKILMLRLERLDSYYEADFFSNMMVCVNLD